MTSPATEEKLRVSRTGKRPLDIPAGVQLKINGQTLSAKGPKGELTRELHSTVQAKQEGAQISLVLRQGEDGAKFAQFQGLSRALVSNMIEGVSKGYEIALDLIGTGYRAEVKGTTLLLNLGLSHQIQFPLPDVVKARVEILDVGGTKKPRLHLSSHDKEILGEVAARVRSFRPPEPYKGKGVRYVGEKVREKAGKAGGKGKK